MHDHHVVDLLLKAKKKGVHVFLEENKLKFKIAQKNESDPELIALLKEQKEEILVFLTQEAQLNKSQPKGIAISRKDRPQKIPLSYNQERLWFLDQLQGSVNYHIPIVLEFMENIRVDFLEACFREILDRHESLRTVYLEESGKVYQKQLSVINWALAYYQESELALPLADFIDQEINKPFDLSKEVMLRGSLVQRTGSHLLIVVMHHIASDGWSMPILVEELTTLYRCKQEGRPSSLMPLPIQYADYAIWQHQLMESDYWTEKLNYWKHRLSGLVPLELPTDYPRPPRPSGKGALAYFEVDKELKEGLLSMARKEGVTLYMLLLSVFKLLLHKYSRQADISVGSPIANRQDAALAPLIGYFVNTLVLRSDFSKPTTFKELLSQVKETTLAAYAHQEVPFEKVVDLISAPRDLSRSPLFQVVFVLQNNAAISEVAMSEQAIAIRPYDCKTAKFDLTMEVTESADCLSLTIEYSTDLFKPSTIERMMVHFKNLLSSVLSDPFQNLQTISLLDAAEQHQLLHQFNDTSVPYPEGETIVSLFAKQAEKTPDGIALVFEENKLTYRQLEEQSNQLAHYLLKNYHIEANHLIGIQLERSEAMIVSILAILKSGAAYVPIDPSYPQERIAYIAADSNYQLCIDAALYQQFTLVQSEISKEALSSHVSPDDLAYVIYTSGTTGNPKGVMIEHRNVVRLFFTEKPLFDFDEKDVWTLFHSYSFDFSVWEIFGALLYGAKLVIVPKMIAKNPEAFFRLLVKEKVTVLNQTPTAFKNLISLEDLVYKGDLSLRYVIFGGEALYPKQLAKWLEHYPATRLINMYGITETTVHVTYKEIGALEITEGLSNIGRPIPTLTVDILDEHLNLVPIGVVGELCVGGAGLARGYLNRRELTEEKFRAHPLKVGQRLYRSGDLGKWLPDGSIEYLGRMDTQVKLRGYRIELEEIAHHLQQVPEISRAIVVLNKDGKDTKRLVAYYLSAKEMDRALMQDYLKSVLPIFMVPQIYIRLETLPLTSNGKIDSAALPLPELFSTGSKKYTAPQTQLEKLLAQMWEELLGLERVGVEDNFFDIGGDSILSIQMMGKMKQEGYQIMLTDIFTYQTIADLAENIENRKAKLIFGEQGRLTGTVPLSPIQRRFFSFEYEEDIHFNQALLFNVSKELTSEMFDLIIPEMVGYHDALRLRFKKEKEEWIQYFADSNDYLEKIDLSHLSAEAFPNELTKVCKYFQKQVPVEGETLIKFILIATPQAITQNRFFVVANHLIFDGVSWRILLDHFNLLASGLFKGAMPDLGLKGTSYREWVNAMIAFADTEAVQKEQTYWNTVVEQYQPLPVDFETATPSLRKDIAICSTTLTEKTTSRLLLVNQLYEASINDVLLAALIQAIKNWSVLDQLTIGMEAHGRGNFSDDIDIVNTIGWFTTLYPFFVKIGKENKNIEDLIKSIKQQKEQIPNDGIGYGIHQYLVKPNGKTFGQEKECWDVVFNYLGQFDNTQSGENSKFGFAVEDKGDDISENFPVDSKFEINSYISNDRYTIEWNYSVKEYRKETVARLLENFEKNLLTIAANVSDEMLLKQNIQIDETILTPLNEQGDHTEVFCISGLGGSPLSLYELGKLLDGEYSLNGFVTSGLDGKTAPLDNVRDLATKYVRELELRVKNIESCVILGYSFGAFVAYEMVCQLLQKNKKIAHLIILDIEAPHKKAFDFFKRDASYAEKICKSIDALLGVNDFKVSVKMEELDNKTKEQQLYLVYKKVAEAGLSFSEQEVKGFIQVYIANVTAAMEYVIDINNKITIPASLIKSDKEDSEITDKQKIIFDTFDFGWSDLMAAPLEVFRVGGNHQTMLKSPHVNDIAQIIRDQLKKYLPA